MEGNVFSEFGGFGTNTGSGMFGTPTAGSTAGGMFRTAPTAGDLGSTDDIFADKSLSDMFENTPTPWSMPGIDTKCHACKDDNVTASTVAVISILAAMVVVSLHTICHHRHNKVK